MGKTGNFEGLQVDRIKLKGVIRNSFGMAWIGSIGLGQGQLAGPCKHGEKLLSSI